jgi:DNA-binding transcriptional MerR regulator
MAEISEIEIPNRALFKASEVCDLLKVQPYVLRTWEAEFRDLGVPKGNSGTRVYRREDIARVQRIKHLLLIEGLTLAGVRRKLEEEAEPPLEAMELPGVATPSVVTSDVKSRITDVKRGLRSLLDLLDAPVAASASDTQADGGFALASPGEPTAAGRGGARRATAHDAEKPASPRRKRSA